MTTFVEEKFEMSERFVAFIDILGFTEIVKGIENNHTNGNLDFKRLKSILNFMDEETSDPNFMNDLSIYVETDNGLIEKELGDPRLTYVSDCMIISAEPTLDGFKGLSRKIHKITADLAFDGVFCRGAITKGKVFHHNKVIFGSSYIKAYKLEEQKAIFPRVIVDPDIIDFFQLEQGEVPLAPAFYGLDTDGFYYLRYWTCFLFPPYAFSFENYLAVVRQWIISKLDTFSGNARVFEKYVWIKEEFNNLIDVWREHLLFDVERIELKVS